MLQLTKLEKGWNANAETYYTNAKLNQIGAPFRNCGGDGGYDDGRGRGTSSA